MKHKRTKRTIDSLHICGNAANLEYRTIIKIQFTEAKICFVLSSKLAAFPQTCKGSVEQRTRKRKRKERKKERKEVLSRVLLL